MTDAASLPKDCPVKALGRSGDSFHFLTAAGQFMSYGATALDRPGTLNSLFAAPGVDRQRWLSDLGPPRAGRRPAEAFNPQAVAERLIDACAALPIFDPKVAEIRRVGTWPGEGGVPVVHAGDEIVHVHAPPDPAGMAIGMAIFPAAAPIQRPALDPVCSEELGDFADAFRSAWAWGRPQDPDVILGVIALGMLGAFPDWRAHLWINGPAGTGKSTLLALIDRLLGGMSSGVFEDVTEASIRAHTDTQARVRIFDEQETTGDRGPLESVIALFRRMSGANGARVLRSSGSQEGVSYHLSGLGIMGSINAAVMTQADRLRWLVVDLKPVSIRPDAARRLVLLENDAAHVGKGLWRRMLEQAGPRWLSANRTYSELVFDMGGTRRMGDTIGSALAAWDLAFHDGSPDIDRLDRASWLAEPFLADMLLAQEEGEGEICLRALLAFLLPREHGGFVSVAEILSAARGGDVLVPQNKLLQRSGLRMMTDDENGQAGPLTGLFVLSGRHPQLDKAFAGTPFREGGHRKALLTLQGVEQMQHPVRGLWGRKRGVLIPLAYLPEAE